MIAREIIAAAGDIEIEFLDLSRTISEFGRTIHPCKTCVSTAMPLCHWPCSCYPNHSLGQIHDWMNAIYPMWVRAHGVMILSPVNWYQASSPLKLMIDRLVCADGGNPDPTSTHGKHADEAKALELADWPYPRHLAGRAYSLVIHGDADGATPLTDALARWLDNMGLVPAGHKAQLNRYIGYMEPYATSHEALDRDESIQAEVRNAAQSLVEAVRRLRRGELEAPGAGLREPRPK
jgi:multimeric flavodoxin WrbA